mmetsp:Transcript_1478/g.4933  ORF Transcript_1478/g.4933 Transcript_1478/m.4933 type:complete len:247 (+) Transcript_1478:473-1213(+)
MNPLASYDKSSSIAHPSISNGNVSPGVFGARTMPFSTVHDANVASALAAAVALAAATPAAVMLGVMPPGTSTENATSAPKPLAGGAASPRGSTGPPSVVDVSSASAAAEMDEISPPRPAATTPSNRTARRATYSPVVSSLSSHSSNTLRPNASSSSPAGVVSDVLSDDPPARARLAFLSCIVASSLALKLVPTYRPCSGATRIMTPYAPPGSSSVAPRPAHHPHMPAPASRNRAAAAKSSSRTARR